MSFKILYKPVLSCRVIWSCKPTFLLCYVILVNNKKESRGDEERENRIGLK